EAYAHAWAEQTYWLTRTIPQVSPLPRDYPAQTLPNTVASSRVVSAELSPEETKALLEDVPSVYHTHINEVLLTALAQTLSAWTGSSRVLFDLEGHGREDLFLDVDVSRTVGWFTSLFPVYLDFGAVSTVPLTGTLVDALNAVKENLRAIPN